VAQPGRLRSTVGTAGVARGGLHGHAVDRWSSRGGEGAWTYGSHMRTYSGSCHCGRVRFEIDAELDHVRVCDCSFCSKRGALVHRVPPERFRMLSEWSELSLYEWNTKTATLFLQDVRRLPLPSPAHSTGAMGDQRPLP